MLEKVYRTARQLIPAEPCALCSQPTHSGIALCGSCKKSLPILQQSPTQLDQHKLWSEIIIPYRYSAPLAPMIQQLKFDHKLHYAKLFGSLMVNKLQQNMSEPPDLILPIPLHPKRLRQRGFNQALEIIRGPARKLGIPIDLTSCIRNRHTEPQLALNAAKRKHNLENAFSLTRPLNGETIALFDDVITTGSTMRAVTHILKNGGAKNIQIWALAYTPPHH